MHDRLVTWGRTRHFNCQGTIQSVEEKPRGRVLLEDGQVRSNVPVNVPANDLWTGRSLRTRVGRGLSLGNQLTTSQLMARALSKALRRSGTAKCAMRTMRELGLSRILGQARMGCCCCAVTVATKAPFVVVVHCCSDCADLCADCPAACSTNRCSNRSSPVGADLSNCSWQRAFARSQQHCTNMSPAAWH